MLKLLPSVIAAVALLAAPAMAQPPSAAPAARAHSGFPVDVALPKPPAPVVADGRNRLLYELRVTNFYSGPLDLVSVDVLGDAGAPLAGFRDKGLDETLMPIGAGQDDATPPHTLGAGRSAVVFLDLALPRDAATPRTLSHTLAFRIKLPDGRTLDRTLTTAAVSVGPPAPVIGPPLRGSRWLAANGLAAHDHRRSFNVIDGHAYLAQRFAIDWVQLSPDGRLMQGDPGANASYPGYGAEVLAVADARVSAIVDGLPENAGANPAESRSVTVDNITGNAIILDLGGGRFALYGHLQPGSLRVKMGDRVRRGQVLAKLGNSGNSDAPHLHFHLVDANSPLGAEGIPYAISSFDQQGIVAQPIEVLEKGQPWPKPTTAPTRYRDSFPPDNAVVDFP